MHALLRWLKTLCAWVRGQWRAWRTGCFRHPRRNACRSEHPTTHPHAPPKPKWVRQEIIRLKALMPDAGCRTVAHCFNRRWAASRQMTVGKTYVAATIRR